MKRNLVIAVFSLITMIFALSLTSCSQPGETVAEGSRRHRRIMSIHQQQLIQDVDKVLLIHEPSKLTDKRIP